MKKIIFILLVLGFIFRMWMASLFPHQPMFDETDYISFANVINNSFWYADCCAKTYGYPLFLSFIFRLFGQGNLYAVVVFQALIDVLTAFVLLVTSRKVFANEKLSLLTFLIYIFNPLSSSYTGLFLSEVLALFLMSLVIYLFISYKNKLGQFILGLVIGWLTYTRIMLWWFTLILLISIPLFNIYFERKKFSLKWLIIFLGFLITVIYPISANWRFFKNLSPIPSVPFVYLDFLHSLEIARWPGLYNEEYFREVPISVSSEHPKIFGEDKDIFMEKVRPRLNAAIEEIQNNPGPFIATRVRNVFLFWDKSHLYFYTDPFYPNDKYIVRIGNILFIFFSIVGINYVWRKKNKNIGEKRLLFFIILLILYFTLPLSLLTPEERITMPVYPALSLFTPLGIYYFRGYLRSGFRYLFMKRQS